MINTEIFFEPIHVTATVDALGQVNLQNLTWQAKTYPIVAGGRQWTEAEGRHVMAEAADGTRFELELRREDLIWYVRKVWRRQAIV
ncbi:MAG: hypothetical protein AB1801_17845 [Chloroflexota bacterium]